MYWGDQVNIWQTKYMGHCGKGESYLILVWWLWTRFHHKGGSCPSSPDHSPSTAEVELYTKGATFHTREAWFSTSSDQHHLQPGYNPLGVRCHRQGQNQLERSPGEEAAQWPLEGTPHPSTQMALPCPMQWWLAGDSPETQSSKSSWSWSPWEKPGQNWCVWTVWPNRVPPFWWKGLMMMMMVLMMIMMMMIMMMICIILHIIIIWIC